VRRRSTEREGKMTSNKRGEKIQGVVKICNKLYMYILYILYV
jgi:hypothetical protein